MSRKLTYVFEVVNEAAFNQAFCAEESPDALLESMGVRAVATASGDHLHPFEILANLEARMTEWKASPEHEVMIKRVYDTLFPPADLDLKAEFERLHDRLDALGIR